MSLGKGLSSLIPPQQNNNSQKNEQQVKSSEIYISNTENNNKNDNHKRNKESHIFQIEVDNIKPNPYQPRKQYDEDDLKDLSNSIREVGIIQPLVVTKVEKENETGTKVEYQLIAGERRLRASKIAGLSKVPAIIRKGDTKRDNLSIALIENIQRSDLNPIETARAYAKLQDEFNLTQQEIATKVGKSRAAVANSLRLLNLPSHMQEAVESKKITESQARSLLAIDDVSRQESIFNDILKNKTTTRKLNKRIKKENENSNSSRENNFWEKQLEEKLALPVSVKKDGEGGQITIKFFSKEEWQRLMDKLTNQDF